MPSTSLMRRAGVIDGMLWAVFDGYVVDIMVANDLSRSYSPLDVRYRNLYGNVLSCESAQAP